MKKLKDGLLYLLVFGPGFGESSLVRIPPDLWLVVDGCGRGGSVPAAELAEQGARWSGIVFTHPHKDHAVGLDAVLDMDGEGPVGCADLALEAGVRQAGSKARHLSGVAEHVLAAIQARWDADPDARWILERGGRRSIGEAELDVLHPTRSELDRYPDPDPDANRISSAILLTWKETRLLLGADVLADGWEGISGRYGPLGDHAAFKVPHHVSLGAHHRCFCAGAVSRTWVATPFNRSAFGLPRFEDGEGASAFLTNVDALHLTGMPVPADEQAGFPREATRAQIRDGLLRLERRLTESVTFKPLPTVGRVRSPNDRNWVMAGFDEHGCMVDFEQGPGCVRVTA